MFLFDLLLASTLAAPRSVPCPDDAVRYDVLVEEGIPEPSFGEDVMMILEAPGGWGDAGLGPLCRDSERPNFVVILAWPDTVDEMCSPMVTRGDVSCSRRARAVINWKRWLNGSSGWPSVKAYRHYVVTHEVGHVLGMGHRRCPDDWSEQTPVMRQQTSERHKSCPRSQYPTQDELDAMSESLAWRFRKLRRETVSDPWERPPEPEEG
jgi:hypothetical protein